VGGPAARAWGIEGTVIQSGFVPFRPFRCAREQQFRTRRRSASSFALLQKVQTTPDYVVSFTCTQFLVDRPGDTFFQYCATQLLYFGSVQKYRRVYAEAVCQVSYKWRQRMSKVKLMPSRGAAFPRNALGTGLRFYKGQPTAQTSGPPQRAGPYRIASNRRNAIRVCEAIAEAAQ